jgi:hypothetical protein
MNLELQIEAVTVEVKFISLAVWPKSTWIVSLLCLQTRVAILLSEFQFGEKGKALLRVKSKIGVLREYSVSAHVGSAVVRILMYYTMYPEVFVFPQNFQASSNTNDNGNTFK